MIYTFIYFLVHIKGKNNIRDQIKREKAEDSSNSVVYDVFV